MHRTLWCRSGLLGPRLYPTPTSVQIWRRHRILPNVVRQSRNKYGRGARQYLLCARLRMKSLKSESNSKTGPTWNFRRCQLLKLPNAPSVLSCDGSMHFIRTWGDSTAITDGSIMWYLVSKRKFWSGKIVNTSGDSSLPNVRTSLDQKHTSQVVKRVGGSKIESAPVPIPRGVIFGPRLIAGLFSELYRIRPMFSVITATLCWLGKRAIPWNSISERGLVSDTMVGVPALQQIRSELQEKSYDTRADEPDWAKNWTLRNPEPLKLTPTRDKKLWKQKTLMKLRHGNRA